MRVITGDECGLLKECLPEQGEDKGVRRINGDQTMARKHGVVGLCWVQPDEDAAFAALSMHGVCNVWERTREEAATFGKYRKRSEIVNIFDNQESILHPATKPIGLHRVNESLLCACNAAGRVGIVNLKKEKVVESFEATKATDRDDANKALITTCTVQPEENRLAVGGNERDLTLFDLATGKESWKAKNARPDPQTLLQQQVWPSAIAFLETNVVAVGSAHKEIRLYDIRQQRRPIALTSKGTWEHRITTLCQLSNGQLVAGDSAGYLQAMDWRSDLNRIVGRYVGPAGSIRAVVAHPEETRLAVAGLDRMLRIYDHNTRKQVHCLYLRQRLNCALVGQELCSGKGNDDRGEAEDAEQRDWDQGDQIEDYVDSDEEEPNLNDGDSEIPEVDGSSAEDGSLPNDASDDDDSDSSHSDSDTEGDSDEDEDEEQQANPRKKAKR